MTEEKKNYYILTDSVEKFKALENAYKIFRENYTITGGGKLIVRENPFLLNKNSGIYLGIYPETKYDEIKKIITMKSNLEGRILESGDGYWKIELKKDKYLIYSKNPDFKNQ